MPGPISPGPAKVDLTSTWSYSADRHCCYHRGVDVDLFAGMRVNDYPAALAWYERLLGSPPTFLATDTEAVWKLAERRWVFIEQRSERAGNSTLTILVDDLDAFVANIAQRGLEPSNWEPNLPGGMRKAVYYDPDGNEFGIGGAPV
jgi:catechol 2,3-dioxygenase-like lactoylglutathione lyase family enzyme